MTFVPYMCIIKEHSSYDVWQLVCSGKIKEANVAKQECLALEEHGVAISHAWEDPGDSGERFLLAHMAPMRDLGRGAHQSTPVLVI